MPGLIRKGRMAMGTTTVFTLSAFTEAVFAVRVKPQNFMPGDSVSQERFGTWNGSAKSVAG